MSTPRDTSKLVKDFICGEILRDPDADLDEEENLFVSGQVDSVGIMRLVAHVESALGIKIPPGDLVPDNFRTVTAMSSYLDGLTRVPGS